MTILSVLCAAVAAMLLLRPARRRTLTRLVPVETSEGHGPRRSVGPIVAVLIAVCSVGAGLMSSGAAGAVVAFAAWIAAATAVRMVRLHRRGRVAAAARAEVAHACRVLAGQLRVGRIPAEALQVAAGDCPVLAPAADAQALGGDPVSRWRDEAAQPGHRGLLVLARAWQVSIETGAPLAPALERVSQALSEDVAVERLVLGEVSAARATGKIMAALPACGIGIGYLIGGRPFQFLVSGPLGWACLLVGVGLAALGVLWIDWLARSIGDGPTAA